MSQTTEGKPVLSQEEFRARKRLLPGALNLIAGASLGCVQWMMGLVDLALNHAVYRQNLLNAGRTQEAITRFITWQVIQQGVLLALCLFIAWAGFNALVAARRKTVIAGAVLALVPIITWFGCVFGIIGGVWVLVLVFRNGDVKAVLGNRGTGA